jgi:hypothetical protein
MVTKNEPGTKLLFDDIDILDSMQDKNILPWQLKDLYISLFTRTYITAALFMF